MSDVKIEPTPKDAAQVKDRQNRESHSSTHKKTRDVEKPSEPEAKQR